MSWTRNIYDQTNRPVGPTTLRKLLVAFGLFMLPVLLFGYIAHQVFEGDTVQLDDRLLLAIHHRSTPILNEIVLRTTDIGGVSGVLGIATVLFGLYAYKRRWQACAQIAAGIGGAGLLNFILKLLFERSRPDLWQHLIYESSYSFPSGHAMLSSALAFTVVALLWHGRYHWHAVLGGAFYMFYVAFTRLYLGVHYPTDIIAGWCVSFAWVLLVGFVLGSVVVPRTKPVR